jgi:dinuclear metal center YbgI/SA1388 family protein
VKVRDVVNFMEKWAGSHLADDWDNVGLMAGSLERDVTGVVIALDVTEETAKFAVENGANTIISHHPVIFRPIRSVSEGSAQGNLLSFIIKNDLNVYSAHTNLDVAPGGVSDALANTLGLVETEVLVLAEEDGFGYGRIGKIENKLSVKDLTSSIREKLGTETIRVYGNTDTEIQIVAVCGGAGGDFIMDAIQAGADAYITGDVKYHEGQMAVEGGLVLVDATHYYTEKPVLNVIEDRLIKYFGDELNTYVYDKSSFHFEEY